MLYWVIKGKINRDIGDILGSSPMTVKKHLERVFAKLGVETRTAAAAMAHDAHPPAAAAVRGLRPRARRHRWTNGRCSHRLDPSPGAVPAIELPTRSRTTERAKKSPSKPKNSAWTGSRDASLANRL